jgi:hypothetical protein
LLNKANTTPTNTTARSCRLPRLSRKSKPSACCSFSNRLLLSARQGDILRYFLFRKISKITSCHLVFNFNFYEKALGRHVSGLGESQLVVANADGRGEQVVARQKYPEYFEDPGWSPDGKVIACGAGNPDESAGRYVVEVSVGAWQMKPLSPQKWRWAGAVEWMPDGKSLLLVASESAAAPYRVWRLAYPGGAAERATANTISYYRLSLAADASALVTTQIKLNTNL